MFSIHLTVTALLIFSNAPAPIRLDASLAVLIVSVFRFMSPLKAFAPILVTFSGSVNAVSAVQFWNAPAPMLVTPAMPVTVFSFVAPLKALFPILVTFAGMAMLVSAVQFWNALAGIAFTAAIPVTFTSALSP